MEKMNTQPVQPAETLPPTSPPQSKGLAIASLVLGIIAVLTGLFYLGSLLGILAIIFGIIALRKKVGKGMAIAGIITGSLGLLGTILAITLVLIAVPALQRSARDTDRKNQVALAVSDITQFQTENQGQLPDPTELSQSYQTATLKFVESGEPTTDTAVYITGKNCTGVTSSRAFKVSVKLENGTVYCQGS